MSFRSGCDNPGKANRPKKVKFGKKSSKRKARLGKFVRRMENIYSNDAGMLIKRYEKGIAVLDFGDPNYDSSIDEVSQETPPW